jgi:hypothetical protein
MLAKSGAVSQGLRQPAVLYARTRCESTRYVLLFQNGRHMTMHSCLAITWSCHTVMRDDYEDVVQSAGRLQTDGWWRCGVTENEEKV